MPDDDLRQRLERERGDADRSYNDALTALDRTLLGVPPAGPLGVAGPSIVPELPGGLLGWWLRPVWQWLTPSFERQQAFNARVLAAIDAVAARDAERTAAFERFHSALLQFLQQITAFVETK